MLPVAVHEPAGRRAGLAVAAGDGCVGLLAVGAVGSCVLALEAAGPDAPPHPETACSSTMTVNPATQRLKSGLGVPMWLPSRRAGTRVEFRPRILAASVAAS